MLGCDACDGEVRTVHMHPETGRKALVAGEDACDCGG